MTSTRIRDLARKIWDYHQLKHELSQADAILVLCSHDTSVAVRGAELALAELGPAADLFWRRRGDHASRVERA